MKENIKNTEIHYRLEGNGESRVVLLHGWGCDMKLMAPVADALVQTHRVLLVDFPGHGESGRPPEPWGVPEYAACLKELLEKTATEIIMLKAILGLQSTQREKENSQKE